MRYWLTLSIMVVIAAAPPALARITKTRSTPSESWNPFLPITIGGGFEYESNKEETDYDFPGLFEYSFSEQCKLSIEPNYKYIKSKSEDVRTIHGFDDLEVTLEYEFLLERRYTPALTALGTIKFPTAADLDIGSPGTDYTIGLIASKDMIYFDADLSLTYTFSGDPEQLDFIEVSLSAEYPLNHYVALLAEVVQTLEVGNGSQNDAEGTLGLAWRATSNLTLEAGVVLKDDGTKQFVFSWEYSIAGEY